MAIGLQIFIFLEIERYSTINHGMIVTGPLLDHICPNTGCHLSY